jgi:hypothetical protein
VQARNKISAAPQIANALQAEGQLLQGMLMTGDDESVAHLENVTQDKQLNSRDCVRTSINQLLTCNCVCPLGIAVKKAK